MSHINHIGDYGIVIDSLIVFVMISSPGYTLYKLFILEKIIEN